MLHTYIREKLMRWDGSCEVLQHYCDDGDTFLLRLIIIISWNAGKLKLSFFKYCLGNLLTVVPIL